LEPPSTPGVDALHVSTFILKLNIRYSTFYEYHLTGVPPMRPLFMEFPETTAEGHNTDYLFMLGPSLLVKPATMLDDEKE
jgi:alpha-glucosidase (family GH31 glycosyl hydrolase)